MKRVSVIIPTFNRAEMLVKCVKSVLDSGWSDLEVIIVDDCSPDDTRGVVEKTFKEDTRIKYIRNGKNSFQAVSRNNGAKIASGDYLFFLDDDNLVHEGIIAELVKVFEENPKAGLVAPMAIQQRPGQTNLVWTLGSDFNRWTSRPKDHKAGLPIGELAEQPCLYRTTYSPNAFMVSRKAFDSANGFDEDYVAIFEESDFGWRIIEAGYEAYITTKARTDHYGFLEPGCVPELRQLGIEKPYRTYCFARNRLRFARRHFNVLQRICVTLVFAPLSAAYYGLVALKNRRPDICRAYIKGTISGILGID